jgi:hypothetical protein
MKLLRRYRFRPTLACFGVVCVFVCCAPGGRIFWPRLLPVQEWGFAYEDLQGCKSTPLGNGRVLIQCGPTAHYYKIGFFSFLRSK